MNIFLLAPWELPEIEPIARQFFEEAKYPGTFCFRTFSNFWEPLLKAGYGSIFVAKFGETIVGLIGALFCPGIYNGQMTAMLHFWYCTPEARKQKIGTKLFSRMESEWVFRQCKHVIAGHIKAINEDCFEKWFIHRGFKMVEVGYHKEIL